VDVAGPLLSQGGSLRRLPVLRLLARLSPPLWQCRGGYRQILHVPRRPSQSPR
jgi:hypothetical protein